MAEKSNETTPARRSFWDEADPFRDFFRSPWRGGLAGRPMGESLERAWSPAVNVTEGDDSYVVTVELAGANKDDVTVECHDNVLTVKGEKRDEREEKDEHRHYVERSYGSFTRSFRMPSNASDDIKASFKDGVLTVDVKKVEEQKPKVVTIES